jgi:hypothetical protein
MMLPIADYAPDLPPNNSEGASANIVNLFPRTKESWGPVGALVPFGGSGLVSQCLGAVTAIDVSANNYIFAGDATSLYLQSPGSSGFTALNTTYTLVAGEKWNFTQYGQAIIAAGWGNNLQSYTLNSSASFANLASSAYVPQARYIAAIRDWVMVGNTYDTTNGSQPQRVQWCAIDDPTTWPQFGSNTEAQLQAGSQIIPGTQGWIMGMVGNLGNADGAVFFERAIWRVVYQGSPTVFGFYPAEGARGTPAPDSIVQMGPLAYYLGEDGFYAFDGAQSTPIGLDRVDKTFFATVNSAYLYNVIGAADPLNRVIMWLYPSINSANGVGDSLLVFNWALNRWGFANVNAEYIFRAITQGWTLDGLDSYDGGIYNLDTLPYPLDSRVWAGGQVLMGAFNGSHRLAYFTGAPGIATADTVEIEPFGSSGKRAFLSATRPLVDSGAPTVQIGTRNRLIDAPSFSAPSAINANGECPVRADARYMRARIQLTGTFTNLQGIEVPQEALQVSGSR